MGSRRGRTHRVRHWMLLAALWGAPVWAGDPQLANLLTAPPVTVEEGALEVFAERQEMVGVMRYLRGDAELRFGQQVLKADEIDFNEESGELEARGNVHYVRQGSEENLYAEKFAYNVDTELGTFYTVRGTVSSASQAGQRVLTTDNPFYLEGEVVHKAGGEYWVYGGTVTNCEPGSPWWTLRGKKTRIEPGKSATIHNGVLRLKNVPLIYFPVFKKSLERVPRQSGFLTPNAGTSSRFGFIVGQSYYWAINRSYDATIGGTLYTSRGVASRLGVRGRPTKRSQFDAEFFGVKDRGQKLDNGDRRKQGGSSFDMRGSASMPGGFRGVAELRYLSSLEFRQAFTQSFEQAVFSQVRSIGFISKSFDTYHINVSLLRDENFQTVVERGDTIVLRKLPSLEFNSHDRQIVSGPLPLWVSFDSSFSLVSRTQNEFQTRRFVQRGEVNPRVMTKFYWKGFHVSPRLGFRTTGYGQQRRRDGSISGENLYRSTQEFELDIVPPSLQRIYKGPKWLGDRVKHVIEPKIRYRYVTGFDDFGSVLRFDEYDLVSNTNQADLILTNRFIAKNDATGQTSEVFSMEMRQRRYFDQDFSGAIVPGRRNVLASTVDFTPFAFADSARAYSPIATTFRIRPSWRYALEWRYDYDPLRDKIVNTSLNSDFNFGFWRVAVGHHAIRSTDTLTPPSNQLSVTVRAGDYNRKGWNAAVHNIYDYRQQIFLYTQSQISYNTDCCGFGVEFRRFAIGPTRNENQIRMSLSIANVGSFGTLRPRERLF